MLTAEIRVDRKTVSPASTASGGLLFDPVKFGKKLSKDLSDLAERELEKAQREDNFDTKPVVIVDGSYNKNESQVKPFGVIRYLARSRNLFKRFSEAYDSILRSSPVRTGKFQNHNIVMFNGVVVARNRLEFRRFLVDRDKRGWKERDEIVFMNISPYARKLERFGVRRETRGKRAGQAINKPRGRFSKRSGFVSIPNGSYTVSRRKIRAMFAGVGYISRTQFEYNNSGLKFSGNRSESRTTFVKDGRPYLYPVIKVSIRTRGLIQ